MTVRLAGRLPKDEANGLAPFEKALVGSPKDRRVVVAVVDVDSRVDPHADGDWQPVVEVLRIELLQGDASEQGQKLLAEAYGARTGAVQMDQPNDEQDDDETEQGE